MLLAAQGVTAPESRQKRFLHRKSSRRIPAFLRLHGTPSPILNHCLTFMKKIITLLGAAVLVCAPSVRAALVITEVMSSSIHAGGTNNGDWFELTNTGGSAVDITGWSWDDSSNIAGSANFGSITSIGAGQSIIFTEETVGAEAAWVVDWGISGVTVVNLGSSVFQGLGSGGDAVNIYNASNVLVTGVTFGAATTGFSFEWDTTGASLGLSVVGQNGAFQAAENGQTTGAGPGIDVGSPGVAAVPEPATTTMLLGGFGMMVWMLRRKRLQA